MQVKIESHSLDDLMAGNPIRRETVEIEEPKKARSRAQTAASGATIDTPTTSNARWIVETGPKTDALSEPGKSERVAKDGD